MIMTLAIFLAILMGLSIGICTLLIMTLKRKNNRVNSLVQFNQLSGKLAVVCIPFCHKSSGKVQLQMTHTTVEIIARTYFPHAFTKGDWVLLVEFCEHEVWVIPVDF